MKSLTLQTPDDWHIHLRDHDFLNETVPASAKVFKRGIIMPNLSSPIISAKMAMDYKERIIKAIPKGDEFEPLMTLYLTEKMTSKTLIEAKESGIKAIKYYPAGATTHSDKGIRTIELIYPLLQTISDEGLILLVHGEVTDPNVDIFDREAFFIQTVLSQIVQNFPNLKIVLEHISTRESIEFVMCSRKNIAATITPQHLLFNRNDLFSQGLQPHHYCLPILKRNIHQEALQKVIALGSKKVFLGTDSAPHEQHKKESACGCAGCYTAPIALPLYAHIFESLNALDKLEGFASHYGADFYGLKRNEKSVTLIQEEWVVPESIVLSNKQIIKPFFAGHTLRWKMSD
jgi:dihydroorotase